MHLFVSGWIAQHGLFVDDIGSKAARIDGAVNVPLHEMTRRVAEVPAGEVWVHCAGGYRASVAASFLAAAGRQLVAIDDSFDNAEAAGLHLVGPDVRVDV